MTPPNFWYFLFSLTFRHRGRKGSYAQDPEKEFFRVWKGALINVTLFLYLDKIFSFEKLQTDFLKSWEEFTLHFVLISRLRWFKDVQSLGEIHDFLFGSVWHHFQEKYPPVKAAFFINAKSCTVWKNITFSPKL